MFFLRVEKKRGGGEGECLHDMIDDIQVPN
jgi:hypothetical protein